MSASRRNRVAGWVLTLAVCAAAVTAVSVYGFNALNPGPRQPIPFSHRIHAGTKDLSCFFCHNSALRSSNAGMPPVEKCLLCHNVIASNWEPIARIRKYYDRGESIPWVRVNRVPDFVRFSHQAHLAAKIDCGHCHGNVKAMDRITPSPNLKMGFCVHCHKSRKATVDCYTCHY